MSSIISNQLKPILNSIISPEQQCGLPNRQIFNNHLNILSAINYSKDFQQLLAIVQFNFYKAFDSISHTFLLKTASKLRIPDSLLTRIQIFFSHLSAKLNLNCYFSDFISVQRGIRQGCPLSMLLFIISIEPLSRKILCSTKIQGISLGTPNLKVSHYDLTFFITSPTLFSTSPFKAASFYKIRFLRSSEIAAKKNEKYAILLRERLAQRLSTFFTPWPTFQPKITKQPTSVNKI